MMQNQPIELPSIEETKEINPLIDKTQGLLRQTDILDQITLFKAAKAKITAINKIAHTNWKNKAAGLLSIKLDNLYSTGKEKKKTHKAEQKQYFNKKMLALIPTIQAGLVGNESQDIH